MCIVEEDGTLVAYMASFRILLNLCMRFLVMLPVTLTQHSYV